VEIRQLRYFAAVAEEQHFGRAAVRVGVSQSALSEQIKALERELRVQLLVRSTRSVSLTPSGEAFYARCVRILREVSDAARVGFDVSGKKTESIAIGAIYPATLTLLPRFLARVSRQFEYAVVHVLNSDTETLVQRVERGALSFAFVRPIEHAHGLKYESIGEDRYVLAMPRASPLTKRDQLELRDLDDQKIISLSKSGVGFTERYFDALFDRAGLTSQIAFKCNDTVSILSLVSAGLGVGFVPAWARAFSSDAVEFRDVAGVDYRLGLGVVWRGDEPAFHPDSLVRMAKLAFERSALIPDAQARELATHRRQRRRQSRSGGA
jgi:DNA-binding transcriptional LysR family regulator